MNSSAAEPGRRSQGSEDGILVRGEENVYSPNWSMGQHARYTVFLLWSSAADALDDLVSERAGFVFDGRFVES